MLDLDLRTIVGIAFIIAAIAIGFLCGRYDSKPIVDALKKLHNPTPTEDPWKNWVVLRRPDDGVSGPSIYAQGFLCPECGEISNKSEHCKGESDERSKEN